MAGKTDKRATARVRGVLSVAAALALLAGTPVGAQEGPAAPFAAARLDDWVVIGPGGGGAQFFPTVSPHDRNVVTVSCNMTGAYISTDAGDSWRMINLRGTPRFFVFDPVDAGTIYAGTNALWRSDDLGRTWRLVFPSPSQLTEIRSVGDHASERFITGTNTHQWVKALCVDPSDSRILYAVIADWREEWLAVSSDRGVTWRKETALEGGTLAVAVDPYSPAKDRTVYVPFASGVHVRENGRWQKRGTPKSTPPFKGAAMGFRRDGEGPVIYAVADATRKGNGFEGGLWISPSGGVRWRQAGGAEVFEMKEAISSRFDSVATMLSDPQTAYVGFETVVKAQWGRRGVRKVAQTTDGGRTWREVLDCQDKDVRGEDDWISHRFSAGWGGNPRSLGVAPGNSDIVYGSELGRTIRTLDGGATWKAVYSRRTERGTYSTSGLDVTTCYGVHFDPFAPERIFISYTDIGPWYSEDGGASWLNAEVPEDWQNTTYWIAFDPEVEGRAWAVMSPVHDLPRPKMWKTAPISSFRGGVCISEDGGKTWTKSNQGMPPTAATHVIVDPRSPKERRTLYVAGFGTGVWKSVDGGSSWALRNEGIDGEHPLAWRLVMDSNGTLYTIIARGSDDGSIGKDGDGALYRSSDGADSWERVTLPEGVNGPNGLAIDDGNPERMYLAAWGRMDNAGDVDGGIYLTADGGKTWKNVESRYQHIYDIALDARDSDVLYSCGFDSSVLRSTDRGENWDRIKGFNFKWGHRVIPDPKDADRIFVTTFGGSVWYGPSAGDPEAVEDIITEKAGYGTYEH